jgi:hypothetical protein
MNAIYHRFLLIGAVFSIALSDVRGADQSRLPPASVFDMAEMQNPETLDLKILRDEVVPVSGSTAKIRQITLEFHSHDWGGVNLRHLAKVYLPVEGIIESKRGMAIINQGASGNLTEGFDLEKEYGALSALKLGIPSMLLLSNLPGDHWGVEGQGPIRRYTAAKFFATGDPHWIHWIALAKVYMRAMTVLSELEDIQAKQFVLAGSSKRAQSIWIVAASDDRVRGIVPMARPCNFVHLLQTHSDEPGALPNPDSVRKEHKGSKHEYLRQVEDLFTTRGYEYMAYCDPYQFLSRVNVPVMYMIGTNDELFDCFDDHGFYPFYGGEKSFAYVANYGHGMATETHAQAYRAWAAHCFWGRPQTQVVAVERMAKNTFRVNAQVIGEAKITEVRLRYCVLKGEQFDDAKDRYQSVAMSPIGKGSNWTANVSLGNFTGRTVYWYVEVRDESQGLESIVTTLLKQTSVPYTN